MRVIAIRSRREPSALYLRRFIFSPPLYVPVIFDTIDSVEKARSPFLEREIWTETHFKPFISTSAPTAIITESDNLSIIPSPFLIIRRGTRLQKGIKRGRGNVWFSDKFPEFVRK
jgi:hypothetical protein